MPSGADLALQMTIALKDEASAKLKELAGTAKETDDAVGGINKNAMLLGGAAVAGVPAEPVDSASVVHSSSSLSSAAGAATAAGTAGGGPASCARSIFFTAA